MYDNQGETRADNENQRGLGGNLVHEGNLLAEGEEIGGEFQTDPHPLSTNNFSGKAIDDNSFHMDKCIEKIHENPRFSEKEREFSQKVDNFIKSKTGKSISLSAFSGYVFLANKILLILTFTEFLFQRFDVITLFLNLVIIFIELGVFTHKHMYKWLLVLLISLLSYSLLF